MSDLSPPSSGNPLLLHRIGVRVRPNCRAAQISRVVRALEVRCVSAASSPG